MICWAIDLWLRMDNAKLQLVAYVATLIAGVVTLFWIEHSSKTKSKAYHRRTSHMSAMAVNRQFLQDASNMKQNVINVSSMDVLIVVP